MAIKTFSDGEAILFGWKTMKSNLLFFIGVLLVVILFSVIPDVMRNLMKEKLKLVSILATVIFGILQIIVGMGLVKIVLKFCGNEKPSFLTLFSCIPLFFKYLFGTLLYTLIILGGFILLLIPGVIWGIRFQYAPYLIIDKGMGPIEALKKSSQITKGAKWELLAFNVVLLIINLLGFLSLIVGIFATIPTAMIAYAFVYRKLLAQSEAVQPSATA